MHPAVWNQYYSISNGSAIERRWEVQGGEYLCLCSTVIDGVIYGGSTPCSD